MDEWERQKQEKAARDRAQDEQNWRARFAQQQRENELRERNAAKAWMHHEAQSQHDIDVPPFIEPTSSLENKIDKSRQFEASNELEDTNKAFAIFIGFVVSLFVFKGVGFLTANEKTIWLIGIISGVMAYSFLRTKTGEKFIGTLTIIIRWILAVLFLGFIGWLVLSSYIR